MADWIKPGQSKVTVMLRNEARPQGAKRERLRKASLRDSSNSHRRATRSARVSLVLCNSRRRGAATRRRQGKPGQGWLDKGDGERDRNKDDDTRGHDTTWPQAPSAYLRERLAVRGFGQSSHTILLLSRSVIVILLIIMELGP
ncbi:hypothetical protein BU24DRAFT_221024 [Aaosphaeria arxii CBS 175.79]|uniref:Uncharacterized protein n=1 Tax=Aaosphaeria arxii CBS 175.79 TaxID=1450172 RepID=A0A6A5XP93_9PLEO|nr:uncharacterized protein BU24DRAFT_221024 [Aaosphaeria arxii CBS 175.79]KAF2014763.1 hypothetical protein BU24DRAFT_221024 [Aaosphaeria arxii CBS 175.79]